MIYKTKILVQLLSWIIAVVYEDDDHMPSLAFFSDRTDNVLHNSYKPTKNMYICIVPFLFHFDHLPVMFTILPVIPLKIALAT